MLAGKIIKGAFMENSDIIDNIPSGYDATEWQEKLAQDQQSGRR